MRNAKRKVLGALGAAAVAAFLAGPAQSDEITLRGASCFPIGSPPGLGFEQFVRDVNEAGKGVVQIELLGGAPAIGSPFTMTRRMARGTYDIVGCPDAYFGNVVPECEALRLSDYTPTEMRKNGAYAYMQKVFNAQNIYFLGRQRSDGPFFLWTSKPLAKPDLTGWNLRVSPVYTPFFRRLGATVQRSNIAQIYTYMENGTVQGFGWPAINWVPAWIKVTKYRIEPGFYIAALQLLVNLKKWNSLTKAQQAVLTKIALEHERANEDHTAHLAAAKAWMAKKGMKTIRFTGADAEKWTKAAKDAGWAQLIARSPKHGPALQRLMRKN
jgi:TRAP-type transport system periplasmic protein